MVGTSPGFQASYPGAAEDRLYSAHVAAEFLGIHRSTLHLAVRKAKVTPDAYTPGGHARFRLETLRRFSDRLALDSATGGDGSIARALSSAVSSLSQITELEPVCEAVVDAALMACPSFAASQALERLDDRPREEFRVIATRGVNARHVLEYNWLRRHPGVDFVSSLAARSGENLFIPDIQADEQAAPEGTRQLFAHAGWRSVAVLPCVSDGQTLGLLVCLGRATCGLSEPEIAALEQLADVMTVALRRGRRDDATRQQTEAMHALILQAQGKTEHTSRDDHLVALRRLCQQGARAKLVCEWNARTMMVKEAPEPLAEALRAAAVEGSPQRAEWTGDDGPTIALATPVPMAEGHASVGAIWRRADMRSGMELALLQVYAQSYASIISR